MNPEATVLIPKGTESNPFAVVSQASCSPAIVFCILGQFHFILQRLKYLAVQLLIQRGQSHRPHSHEDCLLGQSWGNQ